MKNQCGETRRGFFPFADPSHKLRASAQGQNDHHIVTLRRKPKGLRDFSLRLRSVQNDAFSVTLFLTFTFLIVTLRRKPKGLLLFCHSEGVKPRGIFITGFIE